jgi:hypothetical protein
MNGHAITAWLAVLLLRMGSEWGETRQACSKRDKATYLFIVLDKAGYSLQRDVTALNVMVCETELYV